MSDQVSEQTTELVENFGDALMFERPLTRGEAQSTGRFVIMKDEMTYTPDPAKKWSFHFFLDRKDESGFSEYMDLFADGWRQCALAEWRVGGALAQMVAPSTDGLVRVGPYIIMCLPVEVAAERKARKDRDSEDRITGAAEELHQKAEENGVGTRVSWGDETVDVVPLPKRGRRH